MGLDNGFYVKSNKRAITRVVLPEGIIYPFDQDYGEVEIVYHRKDWGWRSSIMNAFGWRTSLDTYSYEINTPEQILTLIELTASWLDKDRWEDEGNSIWEYEYAREHLITDIINFSLIYGFMLQNPDVYLEFYDSF